MKLSEPSSEPPVDLLESVLKSLWGATAWPFRAATAEPLETLTFLDTLRRLEQCVAVQSSGVLWGPNGVGKSRLIQSLIQRLSPKLYRTLVLTHSSLTGSDVIRYLTQQLGLVTKPRRSDQVLALRQHWIELDRLWPILIFEEAQNLSAMALEELRLLSCDRRDTQPPFSLLLVGDATLLDRLQMGVNRPLLTRLGFCLSLQPWTLTESSAYLERRLREVGVHENVFDPPAQDLLLRIAHGLPRAINHLAQRAFEEAARANTRLIRREQVQQALDLLPWLGRLREEET